LSTPFPIKIKNFLCVACHKRAYFTLADTYINDTIILVENQGVSRKPTQNIYKKFLPCFS